MNVTLKSNVKHDGVDYERGQTIEIDEVAGQRLIDGGIAEDTTPKAAPKVAEPKVDESEVEEPKVDEAPVEEPKEEEKKPAPKAKSKK